MEEPAIRSPLREHVRISCWTADGRYTRGAARASVQRPSNLHRGAQYDPGPRRFPSDPIGGSLPGGTGDASGGRRPSSPLDGVMEPSGFKRIRSIARTLT